MGSRLLPVAAILLAGFLLAVSAPVVSHSGSDVPSAGVASTDGTVLSPHVDIETDSGENVTVVLEKRGAPGQGMNGSPIAFDVVVEGAAIGVNAFNVTLDITDSSTDTHAEFTDHEFNRSSLGGMNTTNNGTRAYFTNALLDDTYEPADEITLGEIVVTPTGAGEFTAEPIEATVAGENSSSYATSFGDAETVDVLDGPDPLEGFENRPQDLTGDLLLEDVTGDGSVGIADAQTLFFQRNAIDDEYANFFAFGEDPDEASTVSLSNAQTLFFERNARDAGSVS